jgi:DNA-binding transcriptional ArsR family regulator
VSKNSAEDPSHEAGELFRFGRDFIFDDVAQRRFHYHLLRLTTAGLTEADVEELYKLGRLAFEDLDVTEQSTRIKQRADASTLAVAIADILEAASGGHRARVMIGAVLGAYAVLGIPHENRSTASVLGAVGGALATNPVVLDRIDDVGLTEYFSMQE